MPRTTRRSSVEFVPDLVVPAAIRVAEMGVALLFVALRTSGGGPSLAARLTEWDANYYGDIAARGYPEHIVRSGEHLTQGARFAFAPLYPALVAVVRVFGASTRTSLLVVATLAGLAASIAVHLLARRVVGNRRAGYVACALLGALPMGIVLQMGYAESLTIALSAAALLQAVKGRWWWAAGFACAAGLARPIAGAVALAIPVAAWSIRRGRSVSWRKIAAPTAVGLAGGPLFWIYVWARTGVIDGWFVAQKYGWHSRVDLGQETWHFLRDVGDQPDRVMAAFAAVTIVGFAFAGLVALARGASPPLVVVSIVAIAIALGTSNYWHSKPRILLSAFPLVVLAARPLSKLSTNQLVLALSGGVIVSAWFGAYAVAAWPHAI